MSNAASMDGDTAIETLASVVIPTLNRKEELNTCLASLSCQTEHRFDIHLITDDAPLAVCRNRGLRKARASVVCFLDDDVVCPPTWMATVLRTFESPTIMGVSGPSRIPAPFRRHRALYRHLVLRLLYDQCFVVPESRPGHLTPAGTFVPDPDWQYAGPVQFLEACNMAFRTEAIRSIGGFDEAYGGIGDWSEPDCCFRLRYAFPAQRLWFSPAAGVEHRPSQSGAFAKRRPQSWIRLHNYERFANRWIRPNFRHSLYRGFLRTYYTGHYYGWWG